jgi:predicted nuclease of predicted toxin-antitoxin system
VSLRLLLDESISPFLIRPLAALGVDAESAAQVGLSGQTDRAILKYALDHEMAVVTANSQDFARPHEMETCPGVILLRESGLDREGQWVRLKPAIRFLNREGDPGFLINKVVDIPAMDWFYLMPMAEAQTR